MGLDQRLYWIGKPSRDQVRRLHHRKLSDEIYRWRNNHEIQELFNKKYPEIWDEYKNKYETLNCGYYPIKGLLGKMRRLDLKFANSYEDDVNHVFYNSDW